MAIILMFTLWFALIIGHELAHFLVAKSFGFNAPVLGVGLPFGPKFKVRLGKKTELRIHSIPLGAYVVIPELDAVQTVDTATTHQPSKLWQRAFVVLAGVAFYFAASWFSLWASAIIIGEPIQNIVVKALPPTNTIAANAGIMIDDRLVALDDMQINNADDAVSYLRSHPDAPVMVHIKRDNKNIDLSMKPNAQGKVGMQLLTEGIVDYRKTDFSQSTEIANKQFTVLIETLFHLTSGSEAFTSASPAKKSYHSTIVPGFQSILFGANLIEEDWRNLGLFSSMLAVDLALINLLPLPGFDGAHLLAVVVNEPFKKRFFANRFVSVFSKLWLAMVVLIGFPVCLLRGHDNQN